MAENSKIEWCDHTFNPWQGCTKVSPGCDHCYAEGWSKRSGLVVWGESRRRASADYWRQPLKWNKAAERDGLRRKVFCASLADVFDNQVPEEWRSDLWHLIALTPHLDWLLLTKRPQNITGMLPVSDGPIRYPAWPWANVWLGTTAENQDQLAIRAWSLSQVRAKVRYLSCEPLLEDLNFKATNRWGTTWNVLTGRIIQSDSHVAETGAFHWIICGGESGHGARPLHPDWARSLRDQCNAAGVPYFFKQWGEWIGWEEDQVPQLKSQHGRSMDGNLLPDFHDADLKNWTDELLFYGDDWCVHERVGKKKAGALLDGREWREMPQP